MRRVFLLLIAAWSCFGQSISITNLGSPILTSRFVPTISLVEGSGNRTYRVCIRYNGKRVNPNDCATSAPWSVPVYVGFPGDGDAAFQAIAYDIFGNVLASSPVMVQQVRLNGLRNYIPSVPASGSGTIAPVAWNGHNFGGACPGAIYVDGRMSDGEFWTGGACVSGQLQGTLKTHRFPNGPHEILFRIDDDGAGTQTGGDPFIATNTFTAGNVSGANVTLSSPQQHWLVPNRPVAFASTGTLPTDSGTGSPLVAGAVWGWQTSTTNPLNTITAASASSGVISITLSASPGMSVGATVNILKFITGNTASYTGVCDGSYAVTSISGNQFTVKAPNCPNGTWAAGTSGTEIVTNAYYAIYGDNNTVQFSHTPGGAAISFSSGGAGTHTVSYRMRPGYWGTLPADIFDGYPNGFAYATQTFSNGSHSMELRPRFWEVHLVTGGASVSICPKIYNSDLSNTAIACNSVTYTETDDGGFSNVATVDANGNVSPVSIGWAKIAVACATCDSGNSLPAVTVYVQVQSHAIFPHFAKGGGILNSYTPGQSFFPTSWWYLNPLYATTFMSDPSQRANIGPLMSDSGINTGFTAGVPPSMTEPLTTTCNSGLTPSDLLLQGFAQQWGIQYEYDASGLGWPPMGLGAFAASTGYNRQACLSAYIANLKATGMVHMLFSFDEVNAAIAYQFPNMNGAIGSPNFTTIVVSGGTATATVFMNIEPGNWNQATGLGAAVYYSGATNACLNGWHYVTGHAVNSSQVTTSYTFTTTCGNGSYNSSTDPALRMRYMFGNGKSDGNWLGACILPKYAGTRDYVYQTWTRATDPTNANFSADASLSSMISNGSTLTVNYTGHGIANGQSIHITNASNAALNTVAVVSGATANSFTIPTTAGAGTYNAATDPNLILSVDCGLPNNYFVQVHNAIQAGGNIPIAYGILGSTYGTPLAPKNWNDPAVSDASLLYHSDNPVAIYGEDASVSGTIQALITTSLAGRAYESGARKDLLGTGGLQYQRLHIGYLFNPFLDKPNELFWRPETFVARLEWNKTVGISGFRFAWYQANNTGQFALPVGSYGGGNAMGPEFPTNRVWASIGRDFQFTARELKYILQPRGNAPYLGPMFYTAVTSSSYGNMLKIVCLSESTYTQTVDLSSTRIAGGTMYKAILTGYMLSYTPMASNPTSDTLDLCASPGQTTTYYAQPAGTASDLVSVAFSAPATLPFGATRMAIRVGYYPRLMNDDPLTDCTTGCSILINHYNADAWYQILYLGSNNVARSVGDAQKIPRMN